MTTIKQYRGHTFNPPIEVHLPNSLTPAEFENLLTSEVNPKAAFTFPALDNWLSKLLHNFGLQQNEAHPFHKHPYRLRTLDVQAVDWFWRGRSGHEDKLGFMKIQSRIETDPYVHEGEEKARADWIPGAVFLRGGSVAVLVSATFTYLINHFLQLMKPYRSSSNPKTPTPTPKDTSF